MLLVLVAAVKNIKNVVAESSMANITFGEGTSSSVLVQGFKGSAVEANIRYSNRLDLGLIVSDVPAVIAGVFTRNKVKAAPVLHSISLMSSGIEKCRAVLVNSGNANACTGEEGLQNVQAICSMAANKLNLSPEQIHMCSTGVIGEQLPVEKFKNALPRLVSNLKKDGFNSVATAIMTTDTVPKMAWATIEKGGNKINILGMAKGAGMIAPDMGPPHATMLSFIITDAKVEPKWWQEIITSITANSFNKITVDGDTSTNDTVLALANGLSNSAPIKDMDSGKDFFEAVNLVATSLASQIVADGEGATKLVAIRIKGAKNFDEADAIARTIANSPLVKTAFFGEDPNWGRILAAAGRSGACLDPDKISIFIEDVQIVKKGKGLGKEQEAKAQDIMKRAVFSVTVDLGLGDGRSSMLTCDLSVEYVKINADYRT